MNNHKWTQKAFTDGGVYHGIQTCVNTWGCKNCGMEMDLPLGTNPDQYTNQECKGGGSIVSRINTNKMSALSGNGGMLQGNRHDKRSASVQNLQQNRRLQT